MFKSRHVLCAANVSIVANSVQAFQSSILGNMTLTSIAIVHASTMTPSLPLTAIESFPIWDPQRFRDILLASTTPTGLASSYLAAFSSFTKFGREPACTAAFSSFKAISPTTTSTFLPASYTLGDGSIMTAEMELQTLPAGYPLGYCCQVVSRQIGPKWCCPQCYMFYRHLQLIYWPATHPNTACFANTTRIASSDSKAAAGKATNVEMYITETDGYV